MTDLFLHGRPLYTVFDLLGDKENDITYSLGWALAHSPALCARFMAAVCPEQGGREVSAVTLQTWGRDEGYTDIEIRTETAHVIVEAKRGWNLPDARQLTRYVHRAQSKHNALVVLAECAPDYVRGKLPEKLKGVPVRYLSWKQVNDLAGKSRAGATHAERHLLAELRGYLRGLMSMQDQESNLVYLLVLSAKRPEWSRLTWIEYVTKKRRYFHPYGGNGWPTVPPNYLGFRYGGQLRSIHHVDSYQIVDDYAPFFPEISRRKRGPKGSEVYILYTLGRPIRPQQEVKNGNVYATGRLWASLDLLLTSKTIEQACNLTKKRLAKVK